MPGDSCPECDCYCRTEDDEREDWEADQADRDLDMAREEGWD